MSASFTKSYTDTHRMKESITVDGYIRRIDNVLGNRVPCVINRICIEYFQITIPKSICISGCDLHDKLFHSFSEYFNIHLTTKINRNTDILISKTNELDNTPNITTKLLFASILNIPVITLQYILDSFTEKQILDFNTYNANYRRVKKCIFSNLNIGIASNTALKASRLGAILSVGKANILEDMDCKDIDMLKPRIMLCGFDTEYSQAVRLSRKYNCRCISESWVLHTILGTEFIDYIKDDNNTWFNFYAMKPIDTIMNFKEFDMASH